jgi:hypothetical protein
VGVLSLTDIADLREYERERDDFRREVIALKRLRRVSVGPIVTVVFENRTTIRFQIQEMARAEKMVTDAQVQGELDIYNPLIPSQGELSTTLFIELTSESELREWLPRLVGVERALELRLGGGGVVTAGVEPAHAAQLTREEITASVHYVRFQLTPEEQDAFKAGPVILAMNHPAYAHESVLSPETVASLAADWDEG